MRVGFLVGNQFQFSHFAEIMRYFEEPDVIFFDRTPANLADFDPQWLIKYDAYTRFVPETELSALDGQYDAILSQIAVPQKTGWNSTKLIMTQYSLAKPKVAYGARWVASDYGLVYGEHSAEILKSICPVAKMGNPRFDPFFEDSLHPAVLRRLEASLDTSKKTVLYLPTWGDLSSEGKFEKSLDVICRDYNVIYKPHHNTSRNKSHEMNTPKGVINAGIFSEIPDVAPYLYKVADIVVSEMSGAIFDALYCEVPVVLIDNELNIADGHRKTESSALEIAHRDQIGPVVGNIDELPETLERVLSGEISFAIENSALVRQLFSQRGGCGKLAAEGIRKFLTNAPEHHPFQAYIAPGVRGMVGKRAYLAAKKRSTRIRRKQSLTMKVVSSLPNHTLRALQSISKLSRAKRAERYFRTRLIDKEALQVGARRTRQVRRKKTDVLCMSVKTNQKQRLNQLNKILDSNNFMRIGFFVEAWSNLNSRSLTVLLYNCYCAASNVRFSRRKTRYVRKIITAQTQSEFSMSASKRQLLLRHLGFLSRAIASTNRVSNQSVNLQIAAELLGPLVKYIDVAAGNEDLLPEEQKVVTSNGEILDLAKTMEPVIEVCLLSGFARVVPEESRKSRSAMVVVTRNIVETLCEDGWTILPRLQAGYRGSVPVTGRYPSICWHTYDTGVPGQLHLKVGSFFEYVVFDTRGFSGWASIAGAKLQDLISDVSDQSAQAVYDNLVETLVISTETKYLQQVVDTVFESDQPYIFIPLQVGNDIVAKHAKINGQRILDYVKEWNVEKRMRIVVKRHPKCRDKTIADLLDEGEKNGDFYISNGNIHDLISGAKVVLTVNSGAGAESLLHLKPVITTGGCDYASATLCVGTKEELFSALDKTMSKKFPISELQIKKFLYVYTRQYQLHPTDIEAIAERTRTLVGHAAGR